MQTSPSKSAANRQAGKYQVDTQRASILDAAEALFLEKGLENSTMINIAKAAGITKVTLYRYFPNRDAIAVAVQVRMIRRIESLVPAEEQTPGLESMRRRVQAMIRHFPALREAFRYIGMFDKIYLDNPPDAALTQWTKEQLIANEWGGDGPGALARGYPHGEELTVIMNTVVWFLEKLALRGELTWSDQGVPMEEHLRVFEEMIMFCFDRLEEADQAGSPGSLPPGPGT